MEGREFLRKAGLTLIVFGMIVGFAGAAAAFTFAPWLGGLFYLGFILTMVGFALAVFSKI